MTISVQDLLKLSTSEKASALKVFNGNELLELALAIKNQFSQEDIKLRIDEDKIKRIPNIALRDIIFNDLEHLDIKNKMPKLLKLLGFEVNGSVQPSFEEAIEAQYEVDHKGVSKPKALTKPTDKTEEIVILIRKLHGEGLSLEAQDSIGLSLLHKLVSMDGINNFDYDRIKVSETLIELAPNILNLKWNDKDNPLEWAVRHNDPELLKALTPHYKEDKNKYVIDHNISKESLLHYAEDMGYTELADILKKNGFEYTTPEKLEKAIATNLPFPYDESLTPLENEKRIKHNEKLNYYDFTPQKPKDAKPFLMTYRDGGTILTSDGRKFQSDSMIGFIKKHFYPSFFFSSIDRYPHLTGKDVWFPKFVNRCFSVSDLIKDQLQYSKETGSFFTEKGEFKLDANITKHIKRLIKSKTLADLYKLPPYANHIPLHVETYKKLLDFDLPHINDQLLNNSFLSLTIQNGNLKIAEEFFKRKPGLTQDQSKDLLKLIDKKHENSLEIRQLIRDERKRTQLLEEAEAKAKLEAKRAAKDIASKYYKGGNLQTDNIPPEVQRLFAEIGISTKEGFDKNIKEDAKYRVRYVRDVDMGDGFIYDMSLRVYWLPRNLKVFALKTKAFFTLKSPIDLAISDNLVSKLMSASQKLSKSGEKFSQEANDKFKEYKTKQLQRLHR
jgi:hypothetical protein